jgi:acetyltransferase-like isoleucine patch superfamily enzyme
MRLSLKFSMWSSRLLLLAIRKSLHFKRGEIHSQYSRSLPTGDLFLDRWDVAQFNGFGQGTSCYSSVLVLGTVQVGENCWIGPNVILDGSGGLTIGRNVQISAGAQIYSHNSVFNALTSDSKSISRMSTTIGNNVYIGPNAVIEQGITIGDNAIIGALSLVNKNVPNLGKYYGTELRK